MLGNRSYISLRRLGKENNRTLISTSYDLPRAREQFSEEWKAAWIKRKGKDPNFRMVTSSRVRERVKEAVSSTLREAGGRVAMGGQAAGGGLAMFLTAQFDQLIRNRSVNG